MTLILTILAFITWLFNVITDGFMVAIYWNTYPRSIAVQATTCFAVTLAISLCVAIWAITKQAKGDNFPDGTLTTWKNAEAVFQSIPQLLLNLYVLSSCDVIPSIMQVTSACASAIGIILGLYCINITVEKPEVKTSAQWIAKTIFYSTKVVCITARILIIVYFTFYLKTWTALFLLIHSMALISYSSYAAYGNVMTLFTTGHVVEYAIGLLTLSVWFQFIWLFDERKKWSTLSCSTFYVMENVVLLAIASYYSFIGEPYCLYRDACVVHILLNLATVALAFLYCMIIRFSEDSGRPLVVTDHIPVAQGDGQSHQETAN